jgi:hypothetical protein
MAAGRISTVPGVRPVVPVVPVVPVEPVDAERTVSAEIADREDTQVIR